MNKELPNSAQRVQAFLIENGFSCIVKELPESTRTAAEAANAIGCEVAQIAKSLVFIDKESGNPILVVASGVNRVDTKKIEIATGFHLIKADGKFVKEKMGFAIGGVPPIGHNETVMTFLDPTLKDYEQVWAAAGTPFAVFQLRSNELQTMTGGKFIDLKVDDGKN
ncbi:MAG TPA: YbaK/EbsC family protein [Parachlamydiaceae bacterium]|nr:YbaK/EbsC family protein [Parachlamydiaceae bacterium]